MIRSARRGMGKAMLRLAPEEDVNGIGLEKHIDAQQGQRSDATCEGGEREKT